MSRRASWVGVVVVALTLGGCGPVGYFAFVNKEAQRALLDARALGAPQAAPYEWTSALLYLERSHELAGYARWQESLAMGRRAAALARAAAALARRSSDGK